MTIIHPNPSRAGSALVISSIVIITIAGMAMVLTDLTIARYGEQKHRQAQVDLLAATESAANEAIAWLKTEPGVQEALKNMEISPQEYPTVEKSTSAVLVSSALPAGMTQMYPALITSKTITSPGGTQGGTMSPGTVEPSGANSANHRNACSVQSKIIKVAGKVPSEWDNTDRFIIYTTAEFGDRSNPDSVRRQRVEVVIEAKSILVAGEITTNVPTPAFPFTRGLFSENGYDFKGTATTDSWKSDSNGDGIADTPYKAPASYTVGDEHSNGDVGSNGILGAGAYDTNKVHGEATADAGATLPTVNYDPPTSDYTQVKSITGNATLNGTSTGSTVYRTSSVSQKNGNALTIGGSGTVVLYVDGAFNVGDINFAAGSTAKLVIYQNDITGKGCSFNAQNTIGDANDPSRFLFVTAFSGTGPQEMTLNGGASFSGVVLAPNAGIKFTGGSNFYGAFVGQDFSGAVNGNFKFHYDESLAGLSWGTVNKEIKTPTQTPTLEMLAPIAWNIKTVGYNDP